MKDELTEQQTDTVLKALNEAIENGPWDESNFLRVIGRNLKEIRDDFLIQLGKGEQEQIQDESTLQNRASLRSGQQEVFVALYSFEGNSPQAWERILANLPRQVISRPIYANEEDVKFLIKSKENKVNEAYVGIYVNKADILEVASDKVPFDKFGKALLSLKDRAINLNNISRFVHLSTLYTYSKGRLIKSNNLP